MDQKLLPYAAVVVQKEATGAEIHGIFSSCHENATLAQLTQLKISQVSFLPFQVVPSFRCRSQRNNIIQRTGFHRVCSVL